MFEHVAFYPGDPILGLVEAFQNDPRAEKVNLGIGIYFDDNGRLPVLGSVRAAEEMWASEPRPRPYLPMEGLESYRFAVQKLLFGSECAAVAEGRVATIQTLGGSGALKIGADFLHQWFPHAKAYVSDPTWDNHKGIFEGSGFEVGEYPYYGADGQLRFDDMKAFFEQLEPNSVVLLHPCCHNPTGVDLNREQWNEILNVVAERCLIPFMDIAYQGFGDDLDDDAYAIRKAVSMGLPLFVSNSFSKSLSFYGERVGGLSVVCPSAQEQALVFGQLKLAVRKVYSSPPSHGGHIVSAVMNTPEWYAQWVEEVAQMRERIQQMRQHLHKVLSTKLSDRNFDYFLNQRGMFSYTGLSAEQVARLRNQFGVYLVASGRMCVAGLNNHNIEYVADAMTEVLSV